MRRARRDITAAIGHTCRYAGQQEHRHWDDDVFHPILTSNLIGAAKVQKSICALTFANLAVRIDCGVNHDGPYVWLYVVMALEFVRL